MFSLNYLLNPKCNNSKQLVICTSIAILVVNVLLFIASIKNCVEPIMGLLIIFNCILATYLTIVAIKIPRPLTCDS